MKNIDRAKLTVELLELKVMNTKQLLFYYEHSLKELKEYTKNNSQHVNKELADEFLYGYNSTHKSGARFKLIQRIMA